MDAAAPAPLPPRLIARRQLPLAGAAGVLMLASALTEGLGVVLLVPILDALGKGHGDGRIARLAERIGLPLELGPLLALLVALVLLRGVINLARNLTALRFEASVVDGLRQRAWHALLHADWRELAMMRQSDNASLLITNIDRIGVGLQQLLTGLAALATLAMLGLAALAIAPLAALGGGLGGALVLLAYRGMRRRAAHHGQQLGDAYHLMHARFGEGLRTLRAIKSLEAEAIAEARALAGMAGLRRSRRAWLRSTGLGQLALQGGGALVLALIVWAAVSRWAMDARAILPLVALFARGLPLLGTVQETWQNWAHARPAITATLDLIARAEAAREPESEDRDGPELARGIELAAVTLRHPGQDAPALDAASLAIPARTTVALVGPSGAGKSTLADIVGGLVSPDSGTVTVDGQAIALANRRAWRRHVAYVQQDPALFAGSIRDNLLLADPAASDAQLRAALNDAAAGFVLALPEGLDTPVGDGGRGLSGGECQRLMLARALLRRPALLILDEATSALDAASEIAVRNALGRLHGRLTIVIVCHRGVLLELADRVVTLESGRIARVEAGLAA